MPKQEVKTWNASENCYDITYVDVPVEKKENKCCQNENNLVKIKQGVNAPDGDPAWIQYRCNVCGTIITSA